jgi:WD40 repeat protein
MRPLNKIRLGSSYACRFASDEGRIVLAGTDARLYENYGSRRLARSRPLPNLHSLATSPDQSVVVVKNGDGALALLDPASLEKVSECGSKGYEPGCSPLVSACSKFVIDGTHKGRLTVRDARNLDLVQEEVFQGAMIWALSLCRDGSMLSIAHQRRAENAQIEIRERPFTQSISRRLSRTYTFPTACALSPDGSLVAIQSTLPTSDFALEVLDTKTSEVVAVCRFPIFGTNSAVSWAPDGSILACIQKEKVVLYRPTTLTALLELEVSYPCDLAFSPDGKTLAIGSWEQSKLWSVADLLASGSAA